MWYSSWVDGSWFYENEEIDKEYPQENHEEEMGRSDSPREEEVSLHWNDVTEVAGVPILYSWDPHDSPCLCTEIGTVKFGKERQISILQLQALKFPFCWGLGNLP